MKNQITDYEPLKAPQPSREPEGDWTTIRNRKTNQTDDSEDWVEDAVRNPVSFAEVQVEEAPNTVTGDNEFAKEEKGRTPDSRPTLKPGHGLTFAALFLFTCILYARPSEFYPSPLTASLALIMGSITLAIFIPAQLSIEGTLTARPREVNLVLLLCLTGLLSIPFAIIPAEAWTTFNDTFIRCIVIFIVMVNVVRTQARLKALLFLVFVVSIWLSVGAINDYRMGLTTVEGYRIAGRGSGIFGNANDLALHLVTIMPIAVALFFGTHSLPRKVFLGVSAALMMAAIVLTYSRGGSIGLLFALGFLAWKIGRDRRFAVIAWALIVLTGLLIFAPGNYATRLASIFIPSLDAVGSSGMRQEILYVSVWTALRHPLFGIGMGNFHIVSVKELVSHNAYTQVAAEMGMTALVCYTMFIVTPLKRLGFIVRETYPTRSQSPYYYLAVGLQASLLAYMVTSFFASVAYIWYVYYLVAYAVCLRRIYESETGKLCVAKSEASDAENERRNQVTSLAGREG